MAARVWEHRRRHSQPKEGSFTEEEPAALYYPTTVEVPLVSQSQARDAEQHPFKLVFPADYRAWTAAGWLSAKEEHRTALLPVHDYPKS